MNKRAFLWLLLSAWLGAGVAPQAQAVLANAWHVPDNTVDLGRHMRSPEFEIGTNTAIAVFSGVQKWNNAYGTANQNGGTLFYKGATQTNWNSAPFNWYTNTSPVSTNNQYWRAVFNSATVAYSEVIQYFLYLTFDGVNGVQNPYVHGGDGLSLTTANSNTAAASPFSIRNRAAWLFHNNNRVLNGGTDPARRDVSFWTKIGYLGKTGVPTSRWVDQARIYYTTDGSTPAGALGIPSGTAQVASLAFDHGETDPSPAGDGMWWVGTVSNLPTYTTIKYKIGAWHSSNGEEKFADYSAGAPNTVFSFTMGIAGDPVLTVNGVSADYTATHLFVDEVAGDSVPLTILFSPNQPNLTAVEVFSNLNRRDRATLDANADGIEDGIVPPDGNAIVAGEDANYYKAYPMSPTAAPGQFSLTLHAQKTGAYRLTARYQVAGTTNWVWYSANGRRDHALVVTPKRARDIILYELNALTMGAAGTLDYQRSTFTDLYGGPGARPYDPVTNRFNLAYARNLGVNWLWFQPIHPIGVDGRQAGANGQPYPVGSPYSVKNFFQVNPLMSKANTRPAAMTEFTNFVAAADSAGLSVMLDAAFNHSAWDCELDASGVYYFAPSGNPAQWQPTDEIRAREARVYSLAGNYCSRASSAATIAPAPDRGDFGKWADVHDFFFGDYAALVCQNPANNGNYASEGDWFTYNINGNFDALTRNVWRYFADYALYWLDRTGCPAGTPATQTWRGIDGLRADFGQGLPPQCWEYIINKVRSRKWDFVFMTESLDGGAVTYRSNRHFDLLNENLVFALQNAGTAADYRNAFEQRRGSYGQGLVLLNNTSHDEQSFDDPFQALIRYAVCGAVDGAPMIFYGQELGISRTNGFDLYEENFSKMIPQFKTYNSLQPIFHHRGYGVDFLWPVYAAVNQARSFSPALRSANRWFLDPTAGVAQPNIFAVAKYETANASPNFADVVFAFVNLDKGHFQSGSFNVNITLNDANLFGIKPGRTYNIRNIAAYTGWDANRRNYWQWPGGLSGATLLSNGIFAGLQPVPTTDSGWTNAPFEAQYLKLYDVTPPPAPGVPATPRPWSVGTNAAFSWPAVSDPEGGVSAYHLIVGTAPGGSNVFNGLVSGTAQTVTNELGTTNYASVSAINNAGVEGLFSASSSGILLLDPNRDSDGDGLSNGAEDLAGTNPLDAHSVLRIVSLDQSRQVTWSSIAGRSYQVQATAALTNGLAAISPVILATGDTASFLDTVATNLTRYYRVQVLP